MPRTAKKKTYEHTIKESVFQARVFQLLRLNGFRATLEDGTILDLFFHVFDSRKSIGAGCPDIIALHPARSECWFIELKTEEGRLSPKQRVWGKILTTVEELSVGKIKYRVYRPSDLERMVKELGGVDNRLCL
jgi:hypothetical protein